MPKRLSGEEKIAMQVLSSKGVPNREVGRTLGVDEKTVRYHLKRAALGARDRRRDKAFTAEIVAVPIRAWMEARQDAQRPANILELHEHLRGEYGYEGSYRSVLRYVRRHYPKPRIRTYRRVETPPGAQAQTDWGIYPRVDVGKGPERLNAFVMVFSYSRMPAVVWSRSQDLVSWLTCHNQAFTRLAGIPAVNRVDNVKTAVCHGAGAWGVINPVYRAYSHSLGFHIDACLPREPQAKGKTEAKVKLCRRLVNPSRRIYGGLEGLQAETDHRIEQWAKKAICPATSLSIHESWRLELEKMTPLPLLPEPFDVSVTRPVHRDCMVHFECRQYAVPFPYVGRHVEVRGCAGKVQILHDHQILREYPRNTLERILLDPSCYEGEATDRVQPPPPLGRMGRKLQELYEMPVEQRPVDLYAALAEVAR